MQVHYLSQWSTQTEHLQHHCWRMVELTFWFLVSALHIEELFKSKPVSLNKDVWRTDPLLIMCYLDCSQEFFVLEWSVNQLISGSMSPHCHLLPQLNRKHISGAVLPDADISWINLLCTFQRRQNVGYQIWSLWPRRFIRANFRLTFKDDASRHATHIWSHFL